VAFDPVYPAPFWQEGMENEEERERLVAGKKPGPAMRNVGIGLTLGSLVFGAIGAVLLATSGRHDEFPKTLGAAFCVAGGASFLAGVPLWAVGAARYTSPPTSAARASVHIGLGPGTAAMRGRF
jgi:hypothetical protein